MQEQQELQDMQELLQLQNLQEMQELQELQPSPPNWWQVDKWLPGSAVRCSVVCAVCNVQCAARSVFCEMFIKKCTMCSVMWALRSSQCDTFRRRPGDCFLQTNKRLQKVQKNRVIRSCTAGVQTIAKQNVYLFYLLQSFLVKPAIQSYHSLILYDTAWIILQ